MTCSLTPDQLKKLYKVVYKELSNAKNENRPFNMKGFSLSLYNSILEKSKDPIRALAFIQEIPDMILSISATNNIAKHLRAHKISLDTIADLGTSFKDDKIGLNNINKFIGIGQTDPETLKEKVIVNQENKGSTPPGDTPATPLVFTESRDSAKHGDPWSTTMQTADYVPREILEANPDQYNQVTTDKGFYNSVIKSVGDAVNKAGGNSSKARIGTHTGFKLQVISASEMPFEYLYEETKLYLSSSKGNIEKHNERVISVISDNDGNWVYFDKDGLPSNKEEGKPVYSFLKTPEEHSGIYKAFRQNGEEFYLTPEELLAKEMRLAKNEGMPYTEEIKERRLVELKLKRQKQLSFLYNVRKYLDLGKKLLLDINSGSEGIYDQSWTKIGPLISNAELKTITLDSSVSGERGGRFTIRVAAINRPVEIGRGRIKPELSEKIATILTAPLVVNGRILSNQERVNYVKQFIPPNNEYSNFFIVKYEPNSNSIFLNIKNKTIELSNPEEAKAAIIDGLNRVLWKKNGRPVLTSSGEEQFFPSRINLDKDLAARGYYTEYNIEGNTATREERSYFDWIRENAEVAATNDDRSRPAQINAYLRFSPTTKDILDVQQKQTEEETPDLGEIVPQKITQIDTNISNDDYLKGLLKARGLSNAASEEQIQKAKEWFDTSPLSKFISYNSLSNIVNSNALAQWTSAGITLYQGSNFTDLYHEAWHGFSQLYLTLEQKKNLYNEARKLEGTFNSLTGTKIPFSLATDLQLEEFLAEDFRKYILSGQKEINGKPVRNSLFRRIWNFLKRLFGKTSLKDSILQSASLDVVKQMYDKLYVGDINNYAPSISNIQFNQLNKGIEPVEKKDESFQELNLEESNLIVRSLDAEISTLVNLLNDAKSNKDSTTEVLTDKQKLSKVYSNIKAIFEKRRNNFLAQAAETTDEFKKAELLDNARILTYAIDNFGDTNQVISGKQDKGVIAYHQKKTKFLDISSKVYMDDSADAEDAIARGMQRNDRAGNEISIKTLADDEVLYLIKSLQQIDKSTGQIVINRLGSPELVDFDNAWNMIVKTLKGVRDGYLMYEKLEQNQVVFPELEQLLAKLSDPRDTTNSLTERELINKFRQAFDKAYIPLIQLTLHKNVTFQKGGKEVATYPKLTVGESSSDTFKITNNWNNSFRTDSPLANPFIKTDAMNQNYLDTGVILDKFMHPKSGNRIGSAYDFLRSIGFYLDKDNNILRENIENGKGNYGIEHFFNAILAVEQALEKGRQAEINQTQLTKEEASAYIEAKAFIYNPLKYLSTGSQKEWVQKGDNRVQVLTGLRLNNSQTRVRKIIDLYAQYSDSGSDFGVRNATNQLQYLFGLHNTISRVADSVNDANTYQQMTNPAVQDGLDKNDRFKHLRFLSTNRNPAAKASIWMKSLFDMNMFNSDGTVNPGYGERNRTSTEEGSGKVLLETKNLSGIQLVVNEVYPDEARSSAMSDSDAIAKYLTDFHTILLEGVVESQRHEAKATAFGLGVSKINTYSGKIANNLYIDTHQFLSPKDDKGEFYNGFDLAYDYILKGYLNSELERIKIVNSNLDYWKTVIGYNRKLENGKIACQELTVFDDVFSDKLKEELYNLKGTLEEEFAKPENYSLQEQVRKALKSYFDDQVSKNEQMLNANKFIHNSIYEKIRKNTNYDKSIDTDQMDKAAVRSYTFNRWIHNFENNIFIYQDLTQYDHSKQEFLKRNAMFGSTGYSFPSDIFTQEWINNKVGMLYAQSLGLESWGYNGRLASAVIADSKVDSVYFDLYKEFFQKYYTALYNKRTDISEKEKEALVKNKVDSLNPYLGMKDGDAQGWVGFDTYRILKIIEGKWSFDIQEPLYQKTVRGEEIEGDVLEFFPVYKMQYSGVLDTDSLPVVAGHKFSLMPLIPSVIKGTNLEVMHKMMINQKIDYALFSSGSKIATLTTTGDFDKLYKDNTTREINKDLKFTPNIIFAEYLKDQLEIHPEYKEKVIFSTQFRKLAEMAFFANGVPHDFLESKSIDQRVETWNKMPEKARLLASPMYGISQNYQRAITRMTESKRQQLLDEAGWKESKKTGKLTGNYKDLMQLVRQNLDKQDLAEHQIDFIQVDKDGNLLYDLSLHMNAEKIERLLTAMINNRLIRQSSHGEALVQMSSALMEQPGAKFRNATKEELYKYQGTNQLPTYHPGKDGKTVAMKIKISLQGDYFNLLKAIHIDGKPIETITRLNESVQNEEWLDQGNNRKLVSLVGVRIPVQGPNSMEFMEVFEFLDPSAGNIIIPPAEIVAKSGSDFDIDKLNVFMSNIGREGNYISHNYNSREDVQEAIDKVKAKRDDFKNTVLTEIEKDLSGKTKKTIVTTIELNRLEKAFQISKTERTEYIDEIKSTINNLKNTGRIPQKLVDSTTLSESEFLKELYAESNRTDGIDKLDERISDIYKDIVKLKHEKLDTYYTEKKKLAEDLKSSGIDIAKIKADIDKELEPFKRDLSRLYEIKKRFGGGIENEMMESMKALLEHPATYPDLIRPNGNDIIESVVNDGPNDLGQYTQSFDPTVNFVTPKKKKGISPTRNLESSYNISKHEANNVFKRSLGIIATFNTTSQALRKIGGYLNTDYVYTNAKGIKQDRRIKILLDHNSISRVQKGQKTKSDTISLSHLYDSVGEHKISDVINQLINITVDVGKDARLASSLPVDPERASLFTVLLQAGVPFKQAAWFLSTPLVREYVHEERLIKSAFAGPLNKEIPDINYYRFAARANVLYKHFGLGKKREDGNIQGLSPMKLYDEIVSTTDSVLGVNKTFSQKDIEDIVRNNDTSSPLAKAAFLHFLELEESMKGVSNFMFSTNFDTKRSTTLYDAQARKVKLQMLLEDTKFPSELVPKLFSDTVVGNFRVQDLILQLWGPLFQLRNNPTLTQYVSDIVSSRENQKNVQDLFGKDPEKFVSEFKNQLLQFIFQNAARDFNLGYDTTYKGYNVSTDIPIEYVDKLKFGSFVKKNSSGESTIYIDPKQIKKDWVTRAFLSNAEGDNSYRSRHLAFVSENAFMWRGNENEKEFNRFVVEREYLRHIIPLSEYEKTSEYKENFNRIKEGSEAKPDQIRTAVYEQMLRDRALDNTFNPWKMFESTDSVPLKLLKIMQKYPDLLKKYSFLNQLAISSDQKSGINNILMKDQSLDGDKINRYYENLLALANPGIQKVKDPEENARISEFFARLPLFSFMQSGLSKGSNSFTSVVPYEPFLKIMEKPTKKFVDKILSNPSDAKAVLDTFLNMFMEQNKKSTRKLNKLFRNYLLDVTPKALRQEINARATVQDSSPYLLNELRREGMYTYNNGYYAGQQKRDPKTKQMVDVLDEYGNALKKYTPKAFAQYKLLLSIYPDKIFIYNDNLLHRENPIYNKTQGDMRHLDNTVGLITTKAGNENFTAKDIEEAKKVIEGDIQNLIDLRDAGKDLVFSELGYGNKAAMPQEIYRYLSERLFNEFGFMNPGSEEVPSILEIINRNQMITDQEIEDLRLKC